MGLPIGAVCGEETERFNRLLKELSNVVRGAHATCASHP
jgi:hypothetical protein